MTYVATTSKTTPTFVFRSSLVLHCTHTVMKELEHF